MVIGVSWELLGLKNETLSRKTTSGKKYVLRAHIFTPDRRASLILTGIQSTGVPHLGNILGAIIPAIKLSKEKNTESLEKSGFWLL